jgi:3-oxoacyl-[acyl-carrier-protein] synthase II
MVPIEEIISGAKLLVEQGYKKMSPYFIPRILANMSAGLISIQYGLKVNMRFHFSLIFYHRDQITQSVLRVQRGLIQLVGRPSILPSLYLLGDAFRFIKYGDAEMMITGGTEAPINLLNLAGFSRARALSSHFNETPELASRPFDVDRDGFVMGEGAGIIILEELEHALKRGAKVYAEILGYGLSGAILRFEYSHNDSVPKQVTGFISHNLHRQEKVLT